MPNMLTYSEAAKRVSRSPRNIRRWHQEGMRMTMIDGQQFVEESHLLAWWRERMRNSPVHQYRLRAQRRVAGLPDLPRPAPVARAPRPDVDDADEQLEQPRPPIPQMPMVKAGADEYAHLVDALRHVTVPCTGDDRFTADRIPSAELTSMAASCAGCPVRSLCAAFAATGRPQVGFWAGVPA